MASFCDHVNERSGSIKVRIELISGCPVVAFSVSIEKYSTPFNTADIKKVIKSPGHSRSLPWKYSLAEVLTYFGILCFVFLVIYILKKIR